MTPLSLLAEGGKCPRREAAREQRLRCHGAGRSPPNTRQASSSAPRARVLVLLSACKGFARSLAPLWARPLSPGQERGLVVPAGTAQQREGLPFQPSPLAKVSPGKLQSPLDCSEAKLSLVPPPASPWYLALPLHPSHTAGSEQGKGHRGKGRFLPQGDFPFLPQRAFFPSADTARLTWAGQE